MLVGYISVALFAVFVADVFLGATYSLSFLSDTQEMLILLSASILFSIAILRLEKKDTRDD
jgi:hypothetical protein